MTVLIHNTPLVPCLCGKVPVVVRQDVEPQGDPWYSGRTEIFVLCDCGLCLFDQYFHEGFGSADAAAEVWNRKMKGKS